MKIRCRLLNDFKPENKLKVVKQIFDVGDMGLKGAKDIFDEMFYKIGSDEYVEFSVLSNDHFYIFKNNLNDYDIKMDIITSNEIMREMKLLSLGIGDKLDYIDFMLKNSSFDIDKMCKIIELSLNKLNLEEIKEIYNQINFEKY